MADHHWVHDHIASYLAGGLDAAERAELEAHLAGCGDCAKAVDEARKLDRELAALFTAARPTADLEDRAIRRLRLEGAVRPASPFRTRMMRALLVVAATLLMGFVGAGMSYLATGQHPALASESLRTRDDRALYGISVTHDSSASQGRTDADNAIKPAWQIAEESRRRHLLYITNGRHITSDEVGSDADLPTNYNVDRIEEVSVPGSKAGKGGESWGRLGGIPGGFGGIPGGGQGGRSGDTRDERPDSEGGSNSGPGKLSAEHLKKIEVYFSYANKGRDDRSAFVPPELQAIQPGTSRPSGSSARPDDKPAPPMPPSSGEAPKNEPPVRKLEDNLERDGAEQDKKDEAKDEPKEPAKAPAPDAAAERKIIRSGELEFEVESFDSAVERVEKIVAEEKGMVATINSDKLPNGKMRGSVILRVPPQNLDDLIKKLRALGELKRQRLGSQDVTKLYYDMDSRLKAARVMEKRLLEIIAKGGGQVKDLIEAEKELGVWRTRIEELEGEVRYYNNLVSLATLSVILTEKDIRTAYAVVEHRKVDMGIEVEDVEAAQRKAQELILQAKGRVNRSELRKGEGGSLQAIMHFETPPDSAGPLQDSLKQLGVVVRQEVDQSLDAEGGKRPLDSKTTRANAQFNLSLYNLANVNPEQTVHVTLAVADVAEAYKKIASQVEKTALRVQVSSLDQGRADQATATLNFEVKTPDAAGLLAQIKQAGDVIRLQELETGGGQITKAKRGFKISFVPLATVPPREVVSLTVVATSVPKSYQAIQEAAAAARGRVVDSRLDEPDSQNVTAELVIDIPRGEESRLKAALDRAGASIGRSVKRDTQGDGKLDTKVGYFVSLRSQSSLRPRETVALGIEAPEVEKLVGHLHSLVADAKGRTVSSDVSRSRSGEVTARVIYQVPLLALHRLADEFKREGHVSFQTAVRNQQVPDNELAIGQLEITLSSPRPIVGQDEGFAASFRHGLKKSADLGFTGLAWVVTGLVVTSPFWVALLVWYLVRVLRGRRKMEAAA